MIDIFELRDYGGRIKITAKDGREKEGTFCYILEKDEDFVDDVLYINCEDAPWGFFKCDIEKIEKFD